MSPESNAHKNVYDDSRFFDAYMEMRREPGNFNDVVERPAMLRILPNVTGLDVLDLGCGDGALSRACLERGARSTTAIDVSELMLEAARRSTQDDRVIFVTSTIEDYGFPPHSFGIVVSSLALHYVESFPDLASNVARCLRPGGWFVFSIEHPVVTAGQPRGSWCLDDNGDIQHWSLDHYGDEGQRDQDWIVSGAPVVKFHRTVSTHINALIDAGFVVERMDEPVPAVSAIELDNELSRHVKRPGVLMICARLKP